MERIFTLVVLLFFCYSFIGWVWETIYCSIKAKHFVYRGFLLGPITPIYGFGVVGVLYLIEPYQQKYCFTFLFVLIFSHIIRVCNKFSFRKDFSFNVVGL
ncbi:putative ABC transporter permease [Enterococcus viikkiensis]|uniref:putative ABC transporter permease n=1 Tax=Enterococcus viikkiensis TaxID=930854 RepID=UPI003F9278F2